MRLTIRLLGTEIFHVSTDEVPDEVEDDYSRDLSGGNLGCDSIEVTTGDRYMGFTNGREVGDDD